MKRLIERGLMFGNLFAVDSPALVERYNRALRHLTGKTTALADFHIDISGFAPEIGHELEDPLYLNHAGVNRQFILLSTEQRKCPLLNASFSTSRSILRHFIEANEAALFALTARDAVAGELVNSVYRAETPGDLAAIRRIRIEADTTRATVKEAKRLGAMVDRFMTEQDAWHDDVLIADMIGVAKRTGDVTRNPVQLTEMEFEQENFWTSHFGGLYLFRGTEVTGVISAGEPEGLDGLAVERVMSFADRTGIAHFLRDNDLAEPIVEARGVDAAAILRQKMDFMVVDVAGIMGADLSGATRRDLRALARRFAELLPEAFHGLAALLRWAEENGPWPRITSEHPAYFYTLRARRHEDADLVNMLLAELSPLDIRQLFICHKEAFYRAYMEWPEGKKAYVAEFLEREYQVDKAGAREALFGHEDPMLPPEDVAPVAEPPPIPDIVERVGPWGAVRRNR